MTWETDKDPMTAEKATKLKAHEYIMRFKNVGISWEKSKLAAVVLAIEIKEKYFKRFKGNEDERKKAIAHFERLEHDIQAY